MILLLRTTYRWTRRKAWTILKRIQVNSRNVRFPLSCTIGSRTLFEGANRVGDRSSLEGEIGFGTYIGSDCKISAKIGRFCSIASHVKTLSGAHPSSGYVSTSPVFYSLQNTCGVSFVSTQKYNEYRKQIHGFDVTIGNDVWIGYGASIMGGITIGDGAIIGANATVTKDVEPYTIVVGVPGRVLRKRFEPEQIRFLMEFKWWNKPEQWLQENAALFMNIEQFIQATKTP